LPSLKLWQRLLLASSCGLLEFLACPTFDLWPLAWVGFLPLLAAIDGVAPRRAFFYGWLAGAAGNAGGFYWINHLLVRFGHLPWAAAFPLFLLLVAYHGLHWGVWAFLVKRFRGRWPRLPFTLLAPVVMTALELLMPFIFNWYLAITQAWVLPVIQVAELTGPLGVTFLIMLGNGLLYDLLRSRRTRQPWPRNPLFAGAATLAAALLFGFIRLAQVESQRSVAPLLKIGVVQANIGIVQKRRSELAQTHHQLHLELSQGLEQQGAQLLVWPETSYSYPMERSRERDWPDGDRRRIMQGITVPLLFGARSYSHEQYPYNSAFIMETGGRIAGRYDKNFLLVFGEYIPFYKYFPDFKRWFPAASHFARGTEVTTFPFDNYRLAPLICYEDILPDFCRRVAKLKPNLLVNLTNDAWFGRTSEPYEHLALAVYRSVELRLDMVRAVNTGVSAFVEASGRVRSQTASCDPVETPGMAPETLLDTAALMPPPSTVYAAVGDLFGYLNLVLLLALLAWPKRYAKVIPRVSPKKGERFITTETRRTRREKS
jgi:apolipoprotein N-acyltransferase